MAGAVVGGVVGLATGGALAAPLAAAGAAAGGAVGDAVSPTPPGRAQDLASAGGSGGPGDTGSWRMDGHVYRDAAGVTREIRYQDGGVWYSVEV